MVRQIWRNLLDNAIKFSSKQALAVIEVLAENRAGIIEYSVHDNGAGFDMRFVDKLFGVFQRLHSTTEFDGTGVGLAIVQRIVHRHGGRIWARGDVGRGAVFSSHWLRPSNAPCAAIHGAAGSCGMRRSIFHYAL